MSPKILARFLHQTPANIDGASCQKNTHYFHTKTSTPMEYSTTPEKDFSKYFYTNLTQWNQGSGAVAVKFLSRPRKYIVDGFAKVWEDVRTVNENIDKNMKQTTETTQEYWNRIVSEGHDPVADFAWTSNHLNNFRPSERGEIRALRLLIKSAIKSRNLSK